MKLFSEVVRFTRLLSHVPPFFSQDVEEESIHEHKVQECTSSIAVDNLHRLRRLFTDADADDAAASGTAGGGDGAAAARDVRRDEARRDGTPLPTGVIVAAPWRVT